MSYYKAFTLSIVSSCLALSGLSAVRAETTETTKTTTTVTTSTNAVFTLPPTGSYVIVDPITGKIQGTYDPSTKLVDGHTLSTGVVIVNQIDGGPVGFVDASGNIVDVALSPASQALLLSIQTRRQELNQRIDEALNKGTITPAQAAAFRADLERLAAEEASDRTASGVVSYRRALMLGYGLNTLSDRMMPVTRSVRFQPVIAPEFVIVDGRLTLLDKFEYRKHHLTVRCDDEYAAGRLSADQVSSLKDSLNKISSDGRKYTKNGNLSSSRDRKLAQQLDRVQTRMDQNVASINRKRAQIGIRSD
jgi:hypothetical protein